MDYKLKYVKYKNKYQNLKQGKISFGGSSSGPSRREQNSRNDNDGNKHINDIMKKIKAIVQRSNKFIFEII